MRKGDNEENLMGLKKEVAKMCNPASSVAALKATSLSARAGRFHKRFWWALSLGVRRRRIRSRRSYLLNEEQSSERRQNIVCGHRTISLFLCV